MHPIASSNSPFTVSPFCDDGGDDSGMEFQAPSRYNNDGGHFLKFPCNRTSAVFKQPTKVGPYWRRLERKSPSQMRGFLKNLNRSFDFSIPQFRDRVIVAAACAIILFISVSAAAQVPFISQPLVTNPAGNISPGSAFTLTIDGAGFAAGATVNWTFVS